MVVRQNLGVSNAPRDFVTRAYHAQPQINIFQPQDGVALGCKDTVTSRES